MIDVSRKSRISKKTSCSQADAAEPSGHPGLCASSPGSQCRWLAGKGFRFQICSLGVCRAGLPNSDVLMAPKVELNGLKLGFIPFLNTEGTIIGSAYNTNSTMKYLTQFSWDFSHISMSSSTCSSLRWRTVFEFSAQHDAKHRRTKMHRARAILHMFCLAEENSLRWDVALNVQPHRGAQRHARF